MVREVFAATSFMALAIAMCISSGCASHDQRTATTTSDISNGMMCPKCQAVWVREMTSAGPKVTTLQTKPGMTCPDCNAMAMSQLMEDGKVKLHECPTCRMTPQPVSPALSSPKGTHN